MVSVNPKSSFKLQILAQNTISQEKDNRLATLKTRRAELIDLIQQAVDLKCHRERGQTFAEMKKLAALQAKDAKKARDSINKVLDANADMTQKIEDQMSLESASSKVQVNAQVLTAEKARKEKANSDAKTERAAKKQKKEEDENKKDPTGFASKKAAAAKAAAEKATKLEDTKVQRQKVAAEKAAANAKVKMEEAMEKARDPLAFATKKKAEEKMTSALDNKAEKAASSSSDDDSEHLSAHADMYMASPLWHHGTIHPKYQT